MKLQHRIHKQMNNQVSPCSASLKSTWSVSGIRAAESQVSLITGREMNHLLGARFAECLWSGQDMHAHTRSHTHLLQMTEVLECKSMHKNCWNAGKQIQTQVYTSVFVRTLTYRHADIPQLLTLAPTIPTKSFTLKLSLTSTLKQTQV